MSETIEVWGTTYEAWHIQSEYTMDLLSTGFFTRDYPAEAGFWYAEDVGVVKEVHTDIGTGSVILRKELMSMVWGADPDVDDDPDDVDTGLADAEPERKRIERREAWVRLPRLKEKLMHPLMMPLLLSLSFGGVASAHPTTGLPEISLGSNPHRSFIGPIAPGETIPLIDVPTGQEFIVTMVATAEAVGSLIWGGELMNDGIRMVQNSTIVLSGPGITQNSSLGYRNNGKLRFQSGTLVSIQSASTTSPNAMYQVQGYFVQAPSPYRSTYGITSADTGTLHSIFTNTESQDFMIRTVTLRPEGGGEHCDLYIDDTMVIDGTSGFADVYRSSSALPKGMGSITLHPESVIQVKPVSTKPCQYYIDGEYIAP
jgi:hypothetical protein